MPDHHHDDLDDVRDELEAIIFNEETEEAPIEPNSEAAEELEDEGNGANATESSSDLERALLERDEFKAALQRERADFTNYRKRVEREKSEMRSTISADTIVKLLPILDDLDRAIAAAPQEAKDNDWMKGFSMIQRKFYDLLNQMGIVAIEPLGEPFDHHYHEAIGSEDSDEYESGTITTVLQKGFTMDDRCIRVALVKVAN
ncbi:MAG: nucleotide exchange factor GrpE [Anaerolineales bacterium]|nr:nucleotide exchange factor GrpE [Anaerolineales bacterium]